MDLLIGYVRQDLPVRSAQRLRYSIRGGEEMVTNDATIPPNLKHDVLYEVASRLHGMEIWKKRGEVRLP